VILINKIKTVHLAIIKMVLMDLQRLICFEFIIRIYSSSPPSGGITHSRENKEARPSLHTNSQAWFTTATFVISHFVFFPARSPRRIQTKTRTFPCQPALNNPTLKDNIASSPQ
jgi:hypothetical protein